MKQTITTHEFRTAFSDAERNNFSRSGLGELFSYFEDYEQNSGEEMELDVIAICCDYSEEPIKDVLKNYKLESIEELSQKTSVVWYDEETVIYAVF